MAKFKDIAIDETFTFPRLLGSGIADLGLCVKVSARRYAALGRPTVYTVGKTSVEVVAHGEQETVTARAYRAGDRGSVKLGC